jgi:hypothetical protein
MRINNSWCILKVKRIRKCMMNLRTWSFIDIFTDYFEIILFTRCYLSFIDWNHLFQLVILYFYVSICLFPIFLRLESILIITDVVIVISFLLLLLRKKRKKTIYYVLNNSTKYTSLSVLIKQNYKYIYNEANYNNHQ